jgi:anion-transporting  ArsA/GET3 family ATPase
LIDKRLVIVSGKGGTGKSAFAAGLALLAQRQGLRVLAAEIGDGGGLSAHFGAGALAFRPREVRPGLHAMRMVRSEALLEYLSIQLGIKTIARFGPFARAFDALATTAPGIREIITIGKLVWEVREDRWDIVIADAPPTGQIGSYLRGPQTIRELVPSGRVRAQSDQMAAMLSDPGQTELVLMTIPEELPVIETRETLAWLADEKIEVSTTLVANRVLDRLATAKEVSGPIGEAALLHRQLSDEQRAWLERFPTDLQLPYLFGLFTPGEVAAHVSDELEARL